MTSLIVAIFMTLGIISSPEQVNDTLIQQHSDVIIIDGEVI